METFFLNNKGDNMPKPFIKVGKEKNVWLLRKSTKFARCQTSLISRPKVIQKVVCREEDPSQILEDVSPIRDYHQYFEQSWLLPSQMHLNTIGEECKGVTPLTLRSTVKVRLINRRLLKSGTRSFHGRFPVMTEKGTFIYNGAESYRNTARRCQDRILRLILTSRIISFILRLLF